MMIKFTGKLKFTWSWYMYQWIEGTFWKAQPISWGKPWFPVKIFSLKLIHWIYRFQAAVQLDLPEQVGGGLGGWSTVMWCRKCQLVHRYTTSYYQVLYVSNMPTYICSIYLYDKHIYTHDITWLISGLHTFINHGSEIVRCISNLVAVAGVIT